MISTKRKLLCVLAVSLFLASAGYDTTEGIDDLILARNIAEGKGLGLSSQEGPIFDPGPDGRYYLAHEIGNPIFMLPAAVIGRMLPATPTLQQIPRFLAVLNSVALITLVSVVLFDLWQERFGLNQGIALEASVALCFGTMLFPYSKTGTDLVLVSALLVLALSVPLSASARSPERGALILGALLALAFITRPTAALFAPGIFVFFLREMWDHHKSVANLVRYGALIAMPVLLGTVWQGWYNHLRTGDALLPPMMLDRYAHANRFEVGDPTAALVGLLVSPGKSVFLFSPVLIFGILGIRTMYKRFPRELLTIVAVIIPYFIFHLFVRNWPGHSGWGPRFLLPLIAPAFIPAAFWLSEASPRGRRAFKTIALIGLAVQLAAVWNNPQFRFTVQANEGFPVHTTVWHPTRNPIADGLVNIVHNIERMMGKREWDRIPGASEHVQKAANTINVWWWNTPAKGPVRLILLFLIFGLAVFAKWLWRDLFAEARQLPR